MSGGSVLDPEEMEASASRWRRRECGCKAEMIDLREVVERCLRVEALDTDPVDREPEVLVSDRASEMRGMNEGDSFAGGVASGVWVGFSVGGCPF